VTAPADVPFLPGTLVVADLHLDVEDASAVDAFLGFLSRARGAPRLVVLGDLFEYWLGAVHQESPGAQRVLAGLARLSACDVIPGNRDFLLDHAFEQASGARVHHVGLVGRLPDGARLLCLHGDELATADRAYQRLRRVLRSGCARGLARALPLWAGKALARRLRRASTRAVAAKPDAVKALQASAAAERLAHQGASVLVCGHAHAFRDERLPGRGRWLVLDAFGGARDLLCVGPDGVLSVCASRGLR
jgi:UDP-2,3-diacylglucosamine hydrolase